MSALASMNILLAGGQGSSSLIFMVAMFAIFYFMLIRPQRKKDKQVRDMRASLKRGDEIITIGGLHGKIVKITDDFIVLEMEHAKQRIKVQKWAIHSVINPSDYVEETVEIKKEIPVEPEIVDVAEDDEN
ncbi:MAG: preprotein translocase subunit YajC [Eubacteriales bacterium]|nr:preprotein translocase subunit YajC [Eubacteriales bacterium]